MAGSRREEMAGAPHSEAAPARMTRQSVKRFGDQVMRH